MDLRDKGVEMLGAEIVRDPDRCGGDPSIAGTRIGVHDVVITARHRAGNLEQVRDEDLPHLTLAQLEAAMAYYAEHTEEIEEILRRQRDFYERLPAAPRGR